LADLQQMVYPHNRRTGKVRWPNTDVLPLCYATNSHMKSVLCSMIALVTCVTERLCQGVNVLNILWLVSVVSCILTAVYM